MLRGWGSLGRAHVPELLEPVELADARQHDVDDEVLQVHEHPLAFALSLDAVSPMSDSRQRSITRSAIDFM